MPSELSDVISVTPAIRPNRRSSGIATAVAIVVGLAPGRLAPTLIVGKSTRGSGATGSVHERRGAGEQDRHREQRRRRSGGG